mmetsp:Transcript_19207/g.44583  ORF Transcript_19207/g.44583 Transcript_19207/m.44583 type:complete len:214 (+) Transcript_19207:469-1110(+)
MIFVHSKPFTGNSVTIAQPFRLLTMCIPKSSKQTNPKKRKTESQPMEDEPEAVIVPEEEATCAAVTTTTYSSKRTNVFTGGYANAIPFLAQQYTELLTDINWIQCSQPISDNSKPWNTPDSSRFQLRLSFPFCHLRHGNRDFHTTSPSILPTNARSPGSLPMESAFSVTGPGPPIEMRSSPPNLTTTPMDILTNILLCLLGLKQISSRVGSIT